MKAQRNELEKIQGKDIRSKLPIWIKLVVIIEILPMFIGPIAMLYSNGVLDNVDKLTLANLIYLGRNFAVGIALILALCLGSWPMLFILILVRLLTDFVDLPALLYFADGRYALPLAGIFVLFYFIPAFLALRYLWRGINPDHNSPDPQVTR